MIFHRTRTILAVNGKAAALTEWTRDELTAQSLAAIVALPSAAGEALAPFDVMEPGSLRSWTAAPLRTRSGRLVFVDLRLSALRESGETVVLALAIPVEERLAQEREAAQQTRALEAIQHLLALFASPTEETLEWVVQITREMLAADAAGFYRVIPNQPGLRLHTLACVAGVASTFPEVIGPGEAHFLMAPLRWTSGQWAEAFLHQSVRAAGWAHFVAQPVGEPPAILGTLFAAYRPGHSPSAQTPALLAIAARQAQQLIAQIARESKLANAQQLAIRLSGRLAAINAQI
ncbi:MAG: PAS domain-containing protein, partial [Chloroflexi bacterium]|nr:PAS domain-containing protein [Chloroflexota bacterium]